jgi:hypothetical protein
MIEDGTKFLGVDSSVPTPENRSSQANGLSSMVTIEEIAEKVGVINGTIETPVDSANVSYDNTISGIEATNVQTAIDKLAELSGGSQYTETIVNIPSAQILAMGTTPIELLPAAGVGKYYDIEKVILEYTNVTTAYSLAIDYLQIEYNNNTYANLNKSIITQSDNALDIIKNGQENDGTSEVNFTYGNSGMLNQNVRLKVYNSSTNPTLGDGTLRVKIYHKTITFGA